MSYEFFHINTVFNFQSSIGLDPRTFAEVDPSEEVCYHRTKISPLLCKNNVATALSFE